VLNVNRLDEKNMAATDTVVTVLEYFLEGGSGFPNLPEIVDLFSALDVLYRLRLTPVIHDDREELPEEVHHLVKVFHRYPADVLDGGHVGFA